MIPWRGCQTDVPAGASQPFPCRTFFPTTSASLLATCPHRLLLRRLPTGNRFHSTVGTLIPEQVHILQRTATYATPTVCLRVAPRNNIYPTSRLSRLPARWRHLIQIIGGGAGVEAVACTKGKMQAAWTDRQGDLDRTWGKTGRAQAWPLSL